MAEQQTMRAAVIAAPGETEIREVPIPRPGPGEMAVRLEGCGVCGSNLPAWEGRPWFHYPSVPGQYGHEGWGRIAKLGEGVTRFREGDRVAFLSDHAFSEMDVASESAAVLLPPKLDGLDVPGEPLGCVMNIWRRSEIRAGHTVAIVGIGFLGALLTQLAARAGARVIALSKRDYSLKIARDMGARETLSLSEGDDEIVARVEELTSGEGCERVIEAVGLQGPLNVATRLCGVRGRLIIAGFHQDGPRQIDLQQWNWRGLDVVNAHERDPRVYVEGMQSAVEAMLTGELEPMSLLTHRVPLADAGRALELLRSRPDGFVKAVVVP